MGRQLARLPLHPRLAHMVVAGAAEGDALTAAELAVLVTERGLGGTGTDLAHRLDAFRRDRSRRAEDARNLARRWARSAGGDSGESLAPGRHLARAFPDRIAQQAGGRGRFRLANGRQAALEETDALAREAFLVITEITGAAATARIRGAVALDRADLDDLFAHRIAGEVRLSFDPASGSVRARRLRRLDALVLADEPVAIPDPEAASGILAQAAAERVATLPWSKDQLALRGRSSFLRTHMGEAWPDLSDSALAQSSDWLAPYVSGLTRLTDITAAHLGHALDGLLPYAQRQEMERLLPSHFAAPSGSHVPIDYAGENGPTLEIRVQELFGLDRHPSVANGKVPLLVVLLSPAHRPIQTTRDLPGFWRGSWADVRADMRGRYPKHVWPEDPLQTVATNRAKPRAR